MELEALGHGSSFTEELPIEQTFDVPFPGPAVNSVLRAVLGDRVVPPVRIISAGPSAALSAVSVSSRRCSKFTPSARRWSVNASRASRLVQSAEFSFDGTRIVTAGLDTARVWD